MKIAITRRAQRGLTLIEVLVAAAIMATIGVISFQTFSSAVDSKESIERNLAALSRLDRTWMLLETDLRNVVAARRRQVYGPGRGGEIPPMVVENGDGNYWLTALRGGHSNPLNFPRSEMIRVGYRVEDEVLWRDVWYDLGSVDQDQARSQKMIDGVESVEVRVLSDKARSYSAGPWMDRWPQDAGAMLPMALEVTVTFESYGELKRLYTIVSDGEGGSNNSVGVGGSDGNPDENPNPGGAPN